MKDYYNKLYDFFQANNINTVWDIGCAAGDFAWYGPKGIQYYCTDVSADLIDIAKKTRASSNIEYSVQDLLSADLPSKHFDAACILGVLTAFNDPELVLKKVAQRTNKYIIGHLTLNPNPWDMLVSHKRSSESTDSYQNSYNIFSEETIRRILNDCGFKTIALERFYMTTKLEKTDSSELRSYHATYDNDLCALNQLNILLKDYILIAEKSFGDNS